MTSTGTQQARQFLAVVEQACADLDPVDRSRLLGGLEEHLAELSADGVDLVCELGDPVAYARELRSAAGLPTGTMQAVPLAAVGTGGVGGAVGDPGAAGPATRALPLGPGTAALPLGGGPAQVPASTGPSAGKVLLVVGGVLAFVVVMVVAALVLGAGLFLGGSSTSAPSPVVATQAPEPAVETVAVPDVSGMTQAQAQEILQAVGLAVGSVQTGASDSVDKGTVVRQDPAAGTDIAPGSVVTIVVSSGR